MNTPANSQSEMVVVKERFWLLLHIACTVKSCSIPFVEGTQVAGSGGTLGGYLGIVMTIGSLLSSLSALQDMLKTCEEFATAHNLRFSTDPNPSKCKTKCMAFLNKARDLPSMILCGNPLPWVTSLKHLGTTVTNKIDGCQQDMRQKRAKYIDRNCNLTQEFKFAHPETKIQTRLISIVSKPIKLWLNYFCN